jgi:carboxymethylenebutenolidase
MIEEAYSITTPHGQADAYLYRPEGQGPWPGVLFFTDGSGIRQAKRDMAARLAAAGYAVLMPNPFYRDGPVRDMGHAGKDEDVASIVARYGVFARRISEDNGLPKDIGAWLDFMATQDSVRPGKIGCNGYCMGGYFALAAAGYYPERFAAAASFHGSNLATDSPESPHRRAHLMRGEVELYVGVAEIDPYLQPGETVRLRGALEGAAVSHVMELYEGVAHGFTVSSNEQYDEAAAERHWEAMLAFFARTL